MSPTVCSDDVYKIMSIVNRNNAERKDTREGNGGRRKWLINHVD